MMQTYPDSWYAATRDDYPDRSQLDNSIDCDVCIIGAGLAGLTCAFELVCRGANVVVLEAQSIAFGASGRNAGLVSPGYALGIDKIVDKVGLETARELWQLSVDGVEYVRARINQFDKKLLMNQGAYHVLRINNSSSMLIEQQQMRMNFNYDLDYLDTENLRAIIKSSRYYSAVYDKQAFSIHPLNYALRLAAEIEKLGGRIFEQTKARAITDTRQRCEVSTSKAAIKCKNIVFATSAYDHQLHAELKKTILPVATYMAMTEDLGDELDQLITTNAFVSDSRRAGDYYRKIGNRLLWGGRISTRRSKSVKVAEIIANDINQVFPKLGRPEMSHSWYGLMGYTRHKMPLIYPFGHHLWLVSAFGGHGLNTTAMAGQLVASAINDNDDRWKLLKAYQSPWGGGIMNRAAVQIGYWHLKVKDWFDERNQVKNT